MSSDGVIQMFVQPLSSVMVPVSPERNQVSNLDQTAVTNRTLARVNMTIVLSADTAWPVVPHVCHLSRGRTLAVQLFIRVLFCCFHFAPLGFFFFF